MKKRIWILFISCFLVLNSCSKVPEEVELNIENQESDQYGSNSTDETNELSFDTIENIFWYGG